MNLNKVINRLIIPVSHGFEFLCLDEIIYLEADGNYTFLYLTCQKKIHITRQLHEFVDLLHTGLFFRCHQSYMVNLKHVLKYNSGDGGELIMSNNKTLAVSRQYKKELMRIIRK